MRRIFFPIVLVGLLHFPSSLKATTWNTNGALNTVQMFAYMLLGFPDDVWSQLSSGTQNALDRDGIIGRYNTILQDMRDAVTASGKATSCSTVPSSGSFQTTSGGTLTFASPQKSAPPSFQNTGAYTVRLEYDSPLNSTTNTKTTIAMEVMCGKSAIYGYRALKDQNGNITRKAEIFYEKNSDGTKNVQFFMYSSTQQMGSMPNELALILNVLSSTQYKMWVVNAGIKGSNYKGYRFASNVSNSGSTPQVSFYFSDISGNNGTCAYTTEAPFLANAGATNTSVSDGTTPINFCSGSVPSGQGAQGCLDFGQTSFPGSTTVCSGLPLAVAPAPGLDPTASLTIAWVEQTMATKMSSR